MDLLVVQGTLKSLFQHHSSKASIFRCSAFFTVQLSRPYMITGKTTALTRWTFVGKVMSLLFFSPKSRDNSSSSHIETKRCKIFFFKKKASWDCEITEAAQRSMEAQSQLASAIFQPRELLRMFLSASPPPPSNSFRPRKPLLSIDQQHR